MPKLSANLQNVIVPVVQSLGCEFWGGYYGGQGTRAILQVFIDKQGGVTVDDCQHVSRQLSAILDVEDLISHEYILEVSSPGLNRPLFTLEQFKQFIGHEVRLKLYAPIGGQSHFVGNIMNIVDEKVILSVAEHELELPFSQIEKANLR